MTVTSKPPVLVAMSGGVDSSVAAALLLRAGHEVMGATLQLQPCEDRELGRSCCGIDSVLQARRVADQLGIAHCVLDCRREFEAQVLRPAWGEYSRGRTPSPCILCNQQIKFGYLLEKARLLGAQLVATGHYARIERDALGRPGLLRGRDPAKDQSYFLFSLAPAQLEKVLFPLGGLAKTEVRELARELGLATAERADSQDACLNSSAEGFAESLRQRFDAPAQSGSLVDREGRELARHEGIHRFTIGQRRGLGVALGARAFVSEVREDGRVVVSTEERDVWASGLTVRLVCEPADGEALPARCLVQIRSRHRAAEARVERSGPGRATVYFEAPQRAVSPGQAAVLYDGERVVAGGWIEQALR